MNRIGLALVVSLVGAVIILTISMRADNVSDVFKIGGIIYLTIVNATMFFPRILRAENAHLPLVLHYIVSYMLILLLFVLALIGLDFLQVGEPTEGLQLFQNIKTSALPALFTEVALILLGLLFGRE